MGFMPGENVEVGSVLGVATMLTAQPERANDTQGLSSKQLDQFRQKQCSPELGAAKLSVRTTTPY